MFIRRYATQFTGAQFKIEYREALSLLAKNTTWFEKSSIPSTSVIIKPDINVSARYLPFHTADIQNLTSTFQGQYGIDRISPYIYYISTGKGLRPQVGVRVVTDWHHTQGTIPAVNYPVGFPQLQIYAGFRYPRFYTEKLLMVKSSNLLKILSESDLMDSEGNKIIMEPHEMNIAYAVEKIVNQLHHFETQRAEQYIKNIHNADRARIHNLTLNLETATIELISYYLPAYVYAYKVQQHYFYKIVNGITGDIKGTHIYSPIKMFFTTGIIGAFLTPFITPFLGPVSILIVRSIIGGLFSGTLGALGTKFLMWYTPFVHHHQQTNEIKHNETFQSTMDDERRREEARDANGGAHRGIQPEASKYTILGLSSGREYTITDIKTAYYREIKKWHPDCYSGNKEVAKQMTIQLNQAYKELIEYVKI